jgi:NADP-dependent aldehyde dehydrogenase
MFVLPEALAARGAEIGAGWAGSLTMGAGQFCTNPGLVLLPAGDGADAFLEAATQALGAAAEQTMLTDGIAQAYHSGQSQIAATEGVTTKVSETAGGAPVARRASRRVGQGVPCQSQSCA